MDIQNNNVTIQINAKDLSGKTLRISDCDIFVVHVFTDDPKRYLTFSKRDMLMTEFVDELVVPRHQMERLNSGVVQYIYDYLPNNHECKYEGVNEEVGDDCNNPFHLHHKHHIHEDLIHSKPVVTPIYWRNVHHPHPNFPLNSVTLFDIERLQREIDAERISREKDVQDLQSQFGEGFSDKLDAEIERSKAEDERISAALTAIGVSLGELGENVGGNQEETKNEITQNKVDIASEIARATAKETELQQAIDGEISRAKSQEEVLATTLQMEKERASANEANINDRLVSLTDRFEANKELVGETLKSEIERSKSVESSLNEKINNVNSALASEVQRAAEKDIEHTNLVTTETNRAQAVENKISTDLETEVNRAKDAELHLLNEVHEIGDKVSNLATADNTYKKTEVDNLVNGVKNDLSTLQNQVNNHETTSAELSTKVSGLVADVDKAKADILNEVAKCDAENNKLATDLQTLSDSVYTKTEVDNKVSDINSSIASLENWKANHVDNTEGLSTRVSNLENDMNVAKSDILAEIAKCDAENDKLSTELKTLSDSVYNKSEVDTKVNDLNNSISSLENWKQNHSDNTEGLNEKVTKLIADTEKLSTDLSTETTNRINADTTLTTKVEVAEGKVDAEVERAKAQEKLIGDEVAEIKENATAKHTELSDSIASLNADLTLEIARAKATEKVNSDAIAIINGDVETSGSIKKSLADGKAYTDAEIAKLSLQKDGELADTLKLYATNEAVDKKISDVIGTAPEALDTLGKISNALSQDNDAISAINEVLSGKANSEDVYNKTEIDSVINSVNNALSTEATNRTNSDVTINGRIDDLVVKVNANETANNNSLDSLQSAIDAEAERAKASEKTISDKVDSEVEKLNNKVTDLTAKLIEEIAESDAKDVEIDSNISALNTLLTNVETKIDNEVLRATTKDNELIAKDTELEAKIQANTDNLNSEIARSKQVEKELNDKINSINLSDTNSNLSAEIDRATGAEATIQSNLDAEVTRATAVEATLTTSITDEVSRAKAEEKKLSDKIDAIEIPTIDFSEVNSSISSLNDKVDSEITTARANEKINSDNIALLQNSVNGLTESVNNQSAKDTELEAKIGVNTTAIADEISRSKQAEKALDDKINAIEIPDLTPVTSSVATLDNKVNNVQSTLQTAIDNEITTARAAEKTNADNITKLSGDIKAVDDKVNAIDFTPVNNAVSTLETKVDNEISRAQNAEKINSDNIATLQSSVSGLNDSVTGLNASLTQLSADSTAKDSQIESDLATEKTRAENAESALDAKISVINGDKETVGSIAHSVEEAKHYADETFQTKGDYLTSHQDISNLATKSELEVVENKIPSLEGYAKESDVEKKIADIINGAPEQFDTLKEIADALKNNDDAVSSIVSTLATKANADEVYNKNEVDTSVTAINNAISTLETKVDNSIATVNSQLEIHKNEADSKYQPKGDYLTEHQSLADYYNKETINSIIDGYATKSLVSNIAEEVARVNSNLADKANSSDVYTKSEVDEKIDTIDVSSYPTRQEMSDAIEAIDVTEQLKDYAKTNETTKIVDGNGNVITQMTFDETGEDDAVEVYSKQQCDDRFVRKEDFANLIKTYTEEEFDALTDEEKNNGIVIVL